MNKASHLSESTIYSMTAKALTTTTLFDASRTWIVGLWYCGAILTAVCVLQLSHNSQFQLEYETITRHSLRKNALRIQWTRTWKDTTYRYRCFLWREERLVYFILQPKAYV